MSIDVTAAGPDTVSVVLVGDEGDERADTVLMLLANWLWETFGIEIDQSTVVVTLVFPEDDGEHAA